MPFLPGFLVHGVGFTPFTVLLVLDALRVTLLVLLSCIISALALFASKRHQCSHGTSYAMSLTYHALNSGADAHMADLLL